MSVSETEFIQQFRRLNLREKIVSGARAWSSENGEWRIGLKLLAKTKHVVSRSREG